MNKTLVSVFLLLLLFFALNLVSAGVRSFVSDSASQFQSALWGREPESREAVFAEQQAGEIAGLRQENEELRRAVSLQEKENFQLAGIEVLGKAVGEESVLGRIAEGEAVREGDPVITGEGVAVGQITEVLGRTARIRLLSHPESSLDAKVSASGAAGILKGQGGGMMLLDLIPQEYEMREGDAVRTSRLGGIFPELLLIGRVQNVERSDAESFQRSSVAPAFLVSQLDFLFAITNFLP